MQTGWVTDRHIVRITTRLDKERPTILKGHWYEEPIRKCRNMEISYFSWDEESVDIIVRE